MAQTGETGSAVTRAGFLLAGGLLAMGFAGLAPDRFDECAATGRVPIDSGPSRSVCGEAEPHRLDGQGSAEILLFGGRLDLNQAGPAALEALPAIGPRRAQAIVMEREKRLFSGVGDLSRVRGIGRRTVEGIRPWVEVRPTDDRGARP